MILVVIGFLFLGYVLATILAIAKNRELKSKDYDGLPWIDCFKPSKHFSFIVGYLLTLIPLHIWHQFAIRIFGDCNVCYQRRKCHKGKCGCDARAVISSPLEQCLDKNAPNFGSIVWNKEKYWNRIYEYPIEIKVNYLYKSEVEDEE